MRPLTYKCPMAILLLLLAGASSLALLSTDTAWIALPQTCSWYFVGASIALVLYALSLVPGRVIISDEGLCQKLLFSELRLRWEEMVEWRHSICGVEVEEPQMRAQTVGRWHSHFWIRDKAGRKHHLKIWLVFRWRSKQLADIMRMKGIQGG